MMELYYAVSGLTILSEKLSRDNVDNVIKAIQNTLRKDDNLWKYGLFCSYFKLNSVFVLSTIIKKVLISFNRMFDEQLRLHISHCFRPW